MKILSAAQTREWDRYTIDNEPIASIDLMERAATACTAWLEKYKGRSFKIFCGTGNNGGDSLAIARLLSAGKEQVSVFAWGSTNRAAADFTTNYKRLQATPVKVVELHARGDFPTIDADDIVIDGLFGSGLNRTLQAEAAALVQHINAAHATTIAIDIPSGMPADQPLFSDAVVAADVTLTFQQLKLCFMFPENERFFGNVEVMDIGLHADFAGTVSTPYTLTDTALVKRLYKPRKQFSHKGTYGHALVIAGEKGKMGAAVLCSRACLRSGAGLVSALVPKDQFAIVQTAVPEVMAMAHAELETIAWDKYTTIGIGPGIGTGTEGAKLLKKVLTHFNKPIVLDADGLNLIAKQKELLDFVPAGSIFSPHPKEFERLFGPSANHMERIDKALTAAKTYAVYIIVKGHHSVLACPDGSIYFNNTGNAGMATGGSGDVLTGILTGLLAQSYAPQEAALLGMHIHGLAADIGVQSISQEALIAGDIVEHLGRAYLSIVE